jgi:hypothetical protein
MGAMLCVALMAVFTQAAVASSIGKVQHMLVGSQDHQHIAFSDIVPDHDHADAAHHDDHEADHHDPDNASGDHPAGHHHYPGDLGSSTFVLAATASGLAQPQQAKESVAPGQLTLSNRHALPERPPKTSLDPV